MDRRRVTRRTIVEKGDKPRTRPSPSRSSRNTTEKRASPSRNKVSPVRRSSRPRSAALGPSSKTVVPPSPVKEVKEVKVKEKKEKTKSPDTSSNLPSTLTTNTSSRAPAKLTSTSSVHSSYSSTTQKTVEIRSTISENEKTISQIAEYMRRSISKTVGGDTETESRYSRSASRSVYDDDKSSKAEFSDTENKSNNEGDEDEGDERYMSFSTIQPAVTVTDSSSPPRRKIETPREFGGALGIALLLFTMPILIYYLQWTCDKHSCGFKPLNVKVIFDAKYLLEKVFVAEAVFAYFAFNSILFLASGIIYGRRINLSMESSRYHYNFNALPIAILVTVAAGLAEFFKYPVANFILKHYLRFCIYGLVNAFIISQWCYMRMRWEPNNQITTPLNPYAKTGNFFVDFGLGRQLNPCWLNLIHYKQAFYRISLISTLLFAECFLYKKIQIPSIPADFSETATAMEITGYYAKNIQYDAGAILASSLLLFYILDAIIFEHHLASSFELQGEGFGCLLLIRYVATPYLLSAVAKYFFDRRLPNISNCYILFACWSLLISGLVLKRFSSAIKYKYRTNPANHHFIGIESIHTFQGRRLLLDGFWGRLRQPNYTGDIIALIALASPLYIRFAWPPLISIGLLIALLLHRTVRVNARNISRYHSSWVRYCTKVPNYVLPKIY